MGNRGDSARALSPRERAETKGDGDVSSQMLSHGLASIDECEVRNTAKAQPELCLRQKSAV